MLDCKSRTKAAGLLGEGRRDRGRTVAAAERYRAADLTSYSPPADAAFSSSRLLWRPRPFTDRRPGHVYILACPLDMRLARGGVELPHCTMALYSLPDCWPSLPGPSMVISTYGDHCIEWPLLD